jgi:spermidine/putrescine transport system permease protein
MGERIPRRFALLVAGVYLFLYIPIIILIVFSFNKGTFPTHWLGYTTAWYKTVLASHEVRDALYNSLIVAFSAVFFSVIFGSLYVFYGASARLNRYGSFFYVTLAVPEIVLAAGFVSALYALHISPGLTTLIVVHTVLGFSYVIPIIRARHQLLDKQLLEASYDLGATRLQTMYHVVLPFLFPSIMAASLLVFIISFDDFILSYFCAGSGMQTLPVYLFALIVAGATPTVNVISTLMIITSACLIGLCAWFEFGRQNR